MQTALATLEKQLVNKGIYADVKVIRTSVSIASSLSALSLSLSIYIYILCLKKTFHLWLINFTITLTYMNQFFSCCLAWVLAVVCLSVSMSVVSRCLLKWLNVGRAGSVWVFQIRFDSVRYLISSTRFVFFRFRFSHVTTLKAHTVGESFYTVDFTHAQSSITTNVYNRHVQTSSCKR